MTLLPLPLAIRIALEMWRELIALDSSGVEVAAIFADEHRSTPLNSGERS